MAMSSTALIPMSTMSTRNCSVRFLATLSMDETRSVQIAYETVFEELHRQPQQPRQASTVAHHRNPDREPLQEPVLEQGQEVYEDTAAEQGRHESAPGPPVLENIVHEDA